MPFVIQNLYSENECKAFFYLIKNLHFSQKEAQRLIAKGRLFVDGVAMNDTAGTVKGAFELVTFEPVSQGLQPLFISGAFAVFDKPSGVLVHPQNRHTPYSLIDEIKYHFGRDANISHRLDQETSGLVLAARNKQSERRLKMMFESRDVTKRYLAIVHGHVSRETTIDAPLLRAEDESAMVRMVVKVHDSGKKSQTHIRPLKYYEDKDMTLVEATPYTGRQHQIRVHLFHVKHPIVGDPIYGQDEVDIVRFLDKEISDEERLKKSGARRLLLHANRLEFQDEQISYAIQSKMPFVEEAFFAMT